MEACKGLLVGWFHYFLKNKQGLRPKEKRKEKEKEIMDSYSSKT